MKLLLDMNMSPRIAPLLHAAGFDAVHWADLGPVAALDSTIADFAADRHSVVVTHDLDFGALLARNGQRRPSVIQIRSDDLTPDEIARRLVDTIRKLTPELEAGALVTLDLYNTRIRVLPISQ